MATGETGYQNVTQHNAPMTFLDRYNHFRNAQANLSHYEGWHREYNEDLRPSAGFHHTPPVPAAGPQASTPEMPKITPAVRAQGEAFENKVRSATPVGGNVRIGGGTIALA